MPNNELNPINITDVGCCGLCEKDTGVMPKLWLPVEDGSISLWASQRTLYCRVDEVLLMQYVSVHKSHVVDIFNRAVQKWGDAAPVRFVENDALFDFVITANPINELRDKGYVLASAFFPSRWTHTLRLYPILFTKPDEEQVAALAHEIGHIFGLAHPFSERGALLKQPFGDTGRAFSIMNYGSTGGVVTATDKSDLKRLYDKFWSGELSKINGVPIVQVMPHHESLPPAPPV